MKESTATKLQAHLAAIRACLEAREWAAGKDALTVWETCERADWLLWWAARTPINSHQDIVRVAAKIARTIAHLNTDPRVMAALEAAERWAENPTEENKAEAAEAAVRAAAWAAWAAEAAVEAARAAAEAQKTNCDIVRSICKLPWSETEGLS